ncbi:MAG: hypothetical protein ACW976_01450, partial [Candidatus Ranarchaeia archaeon]
MIIIKRMVFDKHSYVRISKQHKERKNMNQETEFQTIYYDFKSSARLAWKNILCFILGVVAIGIVLVIVTAVIA